MRSVYARPLYAGEEGETPHRECVRRLSRSVVADLLRGRGGGPRRCRSSSGRPRASAEGGRDARAPVDSAPGSSERADRPLVRVDDAPVRRPRARHSRVGAALAGLSGVPPHRRSRRARASLRRPVKYVASRGFRPAPRPHHHRRPRQLRRLRPHRRHRTLRPPTTVSCSIRTPTAASTAPPLTSSAPSTGCHGEYAHEPMPSSAPTDSSRSASAAAPPTRSSPASSTSPTRNSDGRSATSPDGASCRSTSPRRVEMGPARSPAETIIDLTDGPAEIAVEADKRQTLAAEISRLPEREDRGHPLSLRRPRPRADRVDPRRHREPHQPDPHQGRPAPPRSTHLRRSTDGLTMPARGSPRRLLKNPSVRARDSGWRGGQFVKQGRSDPNAELFDAAAFRGRWRRPRASASRTASCRRSPWAGRAPTEAQRSRSAPVTPSLRRVGHPPQRAPHPAPAPLQDRPNGASAQAATSRTCRSRCRTARNRCRRPPCASRRSRALP